MKQAVLFAAGFLIAAASAVAALPADFVFLRDADPSIIQDMRYATANNFTGHRLTGYEAAECIVTKRVADALKRVQRDLKSHGLSLKMYDCYRPQRAVDDMYAWAQDGHEDPALRRYNPKLRKKDLFALGYIAKRSGHSTGEAVDLTVVKLPEPKVAPFDPKADYGDCTEPVERRAPESGVDMGTGYDCSDEKARTRSRNITPEQRKWRNILVRVMVRQGFVNLPLEWWHFSLPGSSGTVFDFPVTRRP